MIRIALMATALLAVVLVPAQGAKEDWREAIVQEVRRHGRPGSIDEVVDYTVVDETAEYVLRPHSATHVFLYGHDVGIPVAAGDHVQVARAGQGMKLKDRRGKQYDCLIVSSRVLPK